jgi:hypothetical protein
VQKFAASGAAKEEHFAPSRIAETCSRRPAARARCRQEARAWLMNRVSVVVTVLFVFGAAHGAQAQYLQPETAPYGGQTYVPYLNMLRGGNPAVNYFGLVRPQLQTQATFQQLQSEITRPMPAPVAPPRNRGVADTGSAPGRFMQYNQYFNTLSSPRAVNYQTVPGSTAATYGRR